MLVGVMSRTKNARKNIFSGIINKIISIFMPFLIRTIIIRVLGMEYLGLDNLFTSILQVLNLAELGMSSAIAYCMYKPIVDKDQKTINALYGFVKKAYRIIGGAILVTGVILIPFLDNLIKGEIPKTINLYILYIIYLGNTVISYLMCAYKNVLLNAYQRLDISNTILTISRLIMYILQICVLFIFKNYYLYIIIMPLCTIVNNLMTSWWVNKIFPFVNEGENLEAEVKGKVKNQIIGIFIGKICVVTRNSFDSIIISSYFGLVLTAIYNNYYYIMNAIVAIMMIFSSSIIPGIGNSIAVESEEKNYKDFIKFNFMFDILAGGASCCLVCLYQPFMKIWVGENGMLPFISAVLFAVYFFTMMIGNIRAAYTEAAGLWWQNKNRAILESVMNLLLNIILGKLFGVNGVLVATILTIIIINFGMSSIVLFKYYFKNYTVKEYFVKSCYYAIITMFASIISYKVTNLITINGLIGLTLRLAVCVIIVITIYYFMYRNLNEYKHSKEWILSNILKKH